MLGGAVQSAGGSGGGGSSLYGAYAVPSVIPSIDADSIVGASVLDGDYLEVDVTNAGPDRYAEWDLGLIRDILGNELSLVHAAQGPRPVIHTDGLIPAGLRIAMLLVDNVPGSYDRGIGAAMIGDGTGNAPEYGRCTSGIWTWTAGPSNASARACQTFLLPHPPSEYLLRGLNAASYDAAGDYVASPNFYTPVISLAGGLSRAVLHVAWTATAANATVRLAGRSVVLPMSALLGA